jgi:hypothetical protein
VGKTFRAAVVAQDLVRPGATGSPERDLLELALELLLGELAPLQPGAGVDDFFDVQLEDVAPAELTLGALASPRRAAVASASESGSCVKMPAT